jgi:hypothetical protein
MKKKTGAESVRAFTAVIERAGATPWRVISDQGREFTASEVQQFFKQRDITHHCMYTSPTWHAGMAERANRTIKDRLYRFMSHRQTQRWVDVIQEIVSGINKSPCSSIGGHRPMDVTFENQSHVHEVVKTRTDEERSASRYSRPRFVIGDLVRIEKYKHRFEKGYTGNFTTEIFSVCEVRVPPLPVTYRLADTDGEVIRGWFYASDLSLVRLPPAASSLSVGTTIKYLRDEQPIWAIERVLKQRRRKGGVLYSLVKWRGFPDSQNSWVPARSILSSNDDIK